MMYARAHVQNTSDEKHLETQLTSVSPYQLIPSTAKWPGSPNSGWASGNAPLHWQESTPLVELRGSCKPHRAVNISGRTRGKQPVTLEGEEKKKGLFQTFWTLFKWRIGKPWQREEVNRIKIYSWCNPKTLINPYLQMFPYLLTEEDPRHTQ